MNKGEILKMYPKTRKILDVYKVYFQHMHNGSYKLYLTKYDWIVRDSGSRGPSHDVKKFILIFKPNPQIISILYKFFNKKNNRLINFILQNSELRIGFDINKMCEVIFSEGLCDRKVF